MLEAEDKSTPWQRILWLKQDGYPDNFLDESFLENLQRNGWGYLPYRSLEPIHRPAGLTIGHVVAQSMSGSTPTPVLSSTPSQ